MNFIENNTSGFGKKNLFAIWREQNNWSIHFPKNFISYIKESKRAI